ncbi:hypothetical protein KIN20_028535 [Parelaphostrongylus tenuis]|uniref:Uncharacterized protein n=1 Tax=Parelaphostrongylus tenuis TaxID=148309 RepID=A0AAD5WES5_PARTN|nr:hypothetical protein KIN20_028535 [Parelaphostrongylus tenuis]
MGERITSQCNRRLVISPLILQRKTCKKRVTLSQYRNLNEGMISLNALWLSITYDV